MSTTADPGPTHPAGQRDPRTVQEKQFLAFGPVAEAFLTGAAAAGVTKLPAEISNGQAPCPTPAGQALVLTLPTVPTRSLEAYRITPGSHEGGGDTA